MADLRQDEVIARLVPDPEAPPDVVRLTGYLGRSTRREFWRLYQTLELNAYMEIAEDDIVHSQPVGGPDTSLSGTLLWVKRGADLREVRTASRTAQAEFLEGDVTREFLALTGGFTPFGPEAIGRNSHRLLTLGCCPSHACSGDCSYGSEVRTCPAMTRTVGAQ